MKLYRLTRSKYAEDLSGEGSSRVGGRWNPRGLPALYTSMTISLALLEVLVHVQDRLLLPDSYTVMEISVPTEKLTRFEQVPKEEFESQELGGSLLRDSGVLGFVVPSVLIPSEQNVILNPGASAYAEVQLLCHYALPIDKRFR